MAHNTIKKLKLSSQNIEKSLTFDSSLSAEVSFWVAGWQPLIYYLKKLGYKRILKYFFFLFPINYKWISLILIYWNIKAFKIRDDSQIWELRFILIYYGSPKNRQVTQHSYVHSYFLREPIVARWNWKRCELNHEKREKPLISIWDRSHIT